MAKLWKPLVLVVPQHQFMPCVCVCEGGRGGELDRAPLKCLNTTSESLCCVAVFRHTQKLSKPHIETVHLHELFRLCLCVTTCVVILTGTHSSFKVMIQSYLLVKRHCCWNSVRSELTTYCLGIVSELVNTLLLHGRHSSFTIMVQTHLLVVPCSEWSPIAIGIQSGVY